MIEPNDKIFPHLDAASASYPGIKEEATFRGWLKNSIAVIDPEKNHDTAYIVNTIQRLIGDDGTWPFVYRLITMRTGKLCLKNTGDHTEITHGIEGEYSFGTSDTEVIVLTDCDIRQLLIVTGVLVQLVHFVKSQKKTMTQEPKPEPPTIEITPEPEKSEPEPIKKTIRKKKAKADDEPGGDGGTSVAEHVEANRGETGGDIKIEVEPNADVGLPEPPPLVVIDGLPLEPHGVIFLGFLDATDKTKMICYTEHPVNIKSDKGWDWAKKSPMSASITFVQTGEGGKVGRAKVAKTIDYKAPTP